MPAKSPRSSSKYAVLLMPRRDAERGIAMNSLGSLDYDPEVRPIDHLWVNSKATNGMTSRVRPAAVSRRPAAEGGQIADTPGQPSAPAGD